MANNKLDSGFDVGKAIGGFVMDQADQLYGIVSLRQIPKYLSGARAQLKVNGEIVGFCFDISWDVEFVHKEINTIDNYLPEDTAPTFVRVTGSLGNFHIPGAGPTAKEFSPSIKSFMHHKYIEIEVRDSQTDELVFYTNKAFISRRSQSIQSGKLSRMQLNFTALGWLDEIKSPVQGTFNGQAQNIVP